MSAPAWVKAPARALLRAFDWYGPYKLRTAGYLREVGWFESFRQGRSVDREGGPLPWITYGAMHFLARRVRREQAVFEYGSGASTLWWAGRVRRLVTCEHDPAWADALAARLPGNVELVRRPLEAGGAYARAVAAYPCAFDIVVVDGRDRVRCAQAAPEGLASGGVIVWDDTERDQYRPGIEWLEARGFRRIEFVGLAPGKNLRSETSIFYREGNCLGI
jgi:hypothetical protein